MIWVRRKGWIKNLETGTLKLTKDTKVPKKYGQVHAQALANVIKAVQTDIRDKTDNLHSALQKDSRRRGKKCREVKVRKSRGFKKLRG